MGACANAALALAVVEVGNLVTGRARVRRLRIDRLEVGELIMADRAEDRPPVS